MDNIKRDLLKEKLFPIIKNRVSHRKDINSENRVNKVNGLTGEKIFQKTYSKYLNNVSYLQALIIVDSDLKKYLTWLDTFPIELLLISKNKAGYKKLKRYFYDNIFMESGEIEYENNTLYIKGTEYYLNLYR